MTGEMMAPDLDVETVRALLRKSFPDATPEQLVAALQGTIETISQENSVGQPTMPSQASYAIASLLSRPLDYYVSCVAQGPIQMFGQIAIRAWDNTKVQFEGRQDIAARIGYSYNLNSGTLFSKNATPIGVNTSYSQTPNLASAYDAFASQATDMETLSLCKLINTTEAEESALILRFRLDPNSCTGLDILIALPKDDVEAIANAIQSDPSVVNLIVRRLDEQLAAACSFSGTKVMTDCWYMHGSRHDRKISQYLEKREY